jgi:hypothetical protein
VQQIKIFKGLESETALLEKQVNTWLAESKVRVIQMHGNIAPQTTGDESTSSAISKSAFHPSDVLLVLLYEEG